MAPIVIHSRSAALRASLSGRLLLLLPLFALALLASPAARATVTITVNGAAQTGPFLFGQKECANQTGVSFGFDLGTTFSSATETVIIRASPTSDCKANANGADKTYSFNGLQTGTVPANVQDFIFNTSDAGTSTCGGSSSSASHGVSYFCVVGTINSGISGVQTDTGVVEVDYALQPPAPPISLAREEGDSHLRLSWSPANAGDKISRYEVFALQVAADTDGGIGAGNDIFSADLASDNFAGFSSSANLDLGNTDDKSAMVNGQTYLVSVRAQDTFGNIGGLADPVAGTPIQIDDFYAHYRRLGGSAAGGGGCASGDGTGWWTAGALLVLLGLWRARSLRRTAGRGSALLVLLALALPQAARAQAALPPRFARSQRWLLVSVKLDRYSPQIDSEFHGTAQPYHDIFHGRAPGRVQVEADWEVLHPFGTLMIGATAGYWQNIGKGIFTAGGAPSPDTALLDVVPFGLVATYRLDWFADRWRWFPVIPYAQAGLTAALWASFQGNGKVSRPNDATASGRGSGWTTGYTTALGFGVPLDLIDSGLSNEAYVDLGLQRTTLFAEYGWTHLDSFNKSGHLILSDRAWRFGLSLEF